MWDASVVSADPERRIARDVVTNDGMLDIWRPRHSRFLESLVSKRQSKAQRTELRREATVAQHSRTLIDHIRIERLTGHDRDRIFEQFYPHLDAQTAILREHRRYVMAVSSWISLQRLMGMHDDAVGIDLLKAYAGAYRVYFDLYCKWIQLPRGAYSEVIRLAMTEARNDAEAQRHRLLGIRHRYRSRYVAPGTRLS